MARPSSSEGSAARRGGWTELAIVTQYLVRRAENAEKARQRRQRYDDAVREIRS